MTSRRELILLALGLSCSVFASPSLGDANGGPFVQSCLDPKCGKVFLHWSEHEKLDPVEYLDSCVDMNDFISISDRIHEDFVQGNIYVYDGLVASRTEIALLASLGKELLLS